MLTVIRNGEFTGMRYPEDKQEYRAFHSSQGEACVWLEQDIVDYYDGAGDAVYQAIAPDVLLSYLKADKKAAIQEVKKKVRDGGVIVDGIRFDTDIMARVSYQDFAAQLATDPYWTIADWRASDGVFVTMDAALYERVAVAVKTLSANVFAWQRAQEDRVDAVADPATAMTELGKICMDYPVAA